MTIQDTGVIDFITTEKSTGDLKLTISDHLEWDEDNEHLYLLQEKINAYLRYIESGEIYEERPDAKNQNIVINIMGKYPLNEEAECFFSKALDAIEGAGFSLRFELLQN